ncbi:hypothetical protein HK107_14095 [Parvularcula sp. ZS-1/3]|uniref:Uncharacterized protein n=1 Tax=Parvularcula mediterranea TaxID=2732508 RepID=A0A7Y3RPJ9_9PROT|nr:hypothetical protein [Parvularcula mediterranea]NNU17460.1 hypothetical protein [Parvularcula mediterranea]
MFKLGGTAGWLLRLGGWLGLIGGFLWFWVRLIPEFEFEDGLFHQLFGEDPYPVYAYQLFDENPDLPLMPWGLLAIALFLMLSALAVLSGKRLKTRLAPLGPLLAAILIYTGAFEAVSLRADFAIRKGGFETFFERFDSGESAPPEEDVQFPEDYTKSVGFGIFQVDGQGYSYTTYNLPMNTFGTWGVWRFYDVLTDCDERHRLLVIDYGPDVPFAGYIKRSECASFDYPLETLEGIGTLKRKGELRTVDLWDNWSFVYEEADPNN